MVGPDALAVCGAHRGLPVGFLLLQYSVLFTFKNLFDFTTAGAWDCEAAVERPSALHYRVDFFLFFGIIGFIVEL